MASRIPSRALRTSSTLRTATRQPARCLATVQSTPQPTLNSKPPRAPQPNPLFSLTPPASFSPSAFAYLQQSSHRSYSANQSPADALASRLQGMYAEAKDEFEIATESTDANAVYAQSDREAARDELEKLKKAWEEIQGEVKEELVQRGLGGRIRELEAAVEDLERRGLEH